MFFYTGRYVLFAAVRNGFNGHDLVMYETYWCDRQYLTAVDEPIDQTGWW